MTKQAAPGPAVTRAIEFIKSNVEKGIWQKGERLPSVSSLARIVRVSHVSLIKAIAILKRDGTISGSERSRMTIGREEPDTSSPLMLQEPLWRMKRVALEKDILTGIYATQERLPSFKELQNRYGTSFRTMRKILRSMVVDGVVALRGKTYLLQNFSTRSYRPRIVFITFRIQMIPRSAINQGQYQILNLFENECFRRDLSPEIVEVDFYNPVETRKALTGPVINKPALGYVFDMLWHEGEVFRQSNIALLERLALLKRPVAILDEVGNLQLPAQFAGNQLMQIFRIEGKKAGSRIARFLLDMGHREVAYVSSQHAHEYSHQRLEGIVEQFSNAGLGDRVRPVVSGRFDNSLNVLLDLSGFDDALVQKVIAVDRTESQAQDQYRSLVEYRRSKSRNQYAPEEVRLLRESVAGIKALARSDVDQKVFNRLCIASVVAAGARLSSMACTPLFEQALSLKNVTAWICSSDGIALSALEFLRNNKVMVPGRISVTGFDNEPVEAFKERLTTFDFNAAGFIPAMLNFLIRPPRFGHLARPAPLEIEGIIIQRETSAPPGK